MEFVEDNEIHVDIPDNIELEDVINLDLWREYDKRCIACGKCNFVCPTCTCTSTQDIFLQRNRKMLEKEEEFGLLAMFKDLLIWLVDTHLDKRHGDRMRFKSNAQNF